VWANFSQSSIIVRECGGSKFVEHHAVARGGVFANATDIALIRGLMKNASSAG
jgi:hypothetical protein